VFIASAFYGREVSDGRFSSDRTHIEDLKDLNKIQLAGGDLFLVGLCTEISRNRVSLSLLDNIPFDLRHSSGVR